MNSNMKPVRDFILQTDVKEDTLIFWLTAGWLANNNDSRVACAAGRQKITSARTGLGSSSSCYLQGTPLFAIMEILPLQQAFGEFCRKSFCSEVRARQIRTCTIVAKWPWICTALSENTRHFGLACRP